MLLLIRYAGIKTVIIKDVEIRSKEVTAKDFYRQRQIPYIFTIDVNKVVSLVKCHAVMERTAVIL